MLSVSDSYYIRMSMCYVYTYTNTYVFLAVKTKRHGLLFFVAHCLYLHVQLGNISSTYLFIKRGAFAVQLHWSNRVVNRHAC